MQLRDKVRMKIWYITLLLLPGIQYAQAQDTQQQKWKDKLHFSLISEMDIAYEFNSQKLQKYEFTLKPQV